jgi:transcriptional regulator with PAS, ATPase and Fis domain
MMSDPERETITAVEPNGEALELIVIGNGPPTGVPLPASGTLMVGRGSNSDLRIDHSSLSRSHARLACAGHDITIEDLGSVNGTSVAGARLAPNTPHPFRRGDVADLGSISVILRPRQTAIRRVVASTPSFTPEIERDLARAAASKLSVLILGETGVGKDVLANRLHALSPRADRPMVRVNCAALSPQLLESELFGYDKGAFSGAAQAKPGLLESADGGTFFLDEIGEMPVELQPKLLRVLEDKMVLRVGAVKPRPIDVRFVAATNAEIEAAVARGMFRADLLHRLNTITFTIPPLRERREQIAGLATELARRAAAELGVPVPAIAPGAMAVLERYDWPGNIRELRNVIDRALALGCDGALEVEHLPTKLTQTAAPRPSGSLQEDLDKFERQRIVDALAECDGNQTKAAALLGMSRTTLIERIRAYGLPRPRLRSPEP